MRRLILFLMAFTVLGATPCFATTKLYLKQPLSSFNSTYGYANPTQSVLAATTSVTKSVTSGTNIQWTKTSGGTTVQWISPPLAAGTTISGTFTANFWGSESSTSCNCGERVVVVLDPGGTGSCSGSTITDTSRGTELTTSVTVQNWTATPTSTAVSAGDRICIQPRITNVGTMGNAFTVTNSYGGKTAAAAGDTYIQFNENLTFQSEAEFIQSVLSDAGASVSLPGVSAAGNAIVVVTTSSIGFTPSVSDTKNTYTQVLGPVTNAFEEYVYLAKNIVGGTTLTFTFAASSNSAVAEYAGVDPDPLDQKTSGTGSGTSASSGNTSTTTAANEIVVGTGSGDGASEAYTVGSGFVARVSTSSIDGFIQDKSVTATGAQANTFTMSPTSTWRAEVVTLKWGTQPTPPPASCTPNGTLLHVGSCG